jgi:hypothetical protein
VSIINLKNLEIYVVFWSSNVVGQTGKRLERRIDGRRNGGLDGRNRDMW